ncbi:hypothetical protein MOP88_13885 [Sphingomonas sp. WKB10]|nr:hypothetical protein [Sphingomonas sp. WKB10]
MVDTFTANMAGLRGPGLTGADKALFDSKLAAGDAQVLAAKQAASVASDAAGINRTFATKADANAALPGLANGLVIQVLKDESQNTARTAYKVNAGTFALIGKIAYVVDDLSNVSQTVTVSFKGQKLNGGTARALYFGGWDDWLQVNGYVSAIATYAGRHRFEATFGKTTSQFSGTGRMTTPTVPSASRTRTAAKALLSDLATPEPATTVPLPAPPSSKAATSSMRTDRPMPRIRWAGRSAASSPARCIAATTRRRGMRSTAARSGASTGRGPSTPSIPTGAKRRSA